MNVYEIITKRILDQLEKGTIPWKRPFKTSQEWPMNVITRKPYRGINTFLLWSQNYESPYWLTYNQAKQLKGTVRKGEKGVPVIFWNWIERENEETGKTEEIPFLRYYTVFNARQTEGITLPDVENKTSFSPIASCERIVTEMPKRPRMEHGKRRASYRPSTDTVSMPDKHSFTGTGEYYATLFHELAHSTGHGSRLKREGITGIKSFGSEQYSKEELVAEMGSAFLCGHAGIEDTTLQNQAAYIAGWKRAIKDDPRLLIHASAQGQKAADYILGQMPENE